jgi:hypothetical protein
MYYLYNNSYTKASIEDSVLPVGKNKTLLSKKFSIFLRFGNDTSEALSY